MVLTITYQDGSVRRTNLDRSFFEIKNQNEPSVAKKCLENALDTGNPLSIVCMKNDKEVYSRKFPVPITQEQTDWDD